MRGKADRKHNNMKKVIIKVIIFIAVLCILFFTFMKSFKVKNINVSGYDYYTKEEIIKKIIKSPFDNNVILLYLKNKYLKKIQIPFVQDIDIEIVNTNTVTVNIYEKSLSGCIEYMGEYMYFDKDGIVVESSKDKIDNVLFIEGLDFNRIVLYKKLEIQNDELFGIIMNLTQLINKYEVPVDKISFNKDEEVTLYAGNIRFLLGKQEIYDERITRAGDLLPQAKQFDSGYFDLRNFNASQKKIIFHKD